MSDEEKTMPVRNLRTMHGRKDRKKMVNLKYKDHPRHRARSFLGYLILGVVAFLVLYFMLHPK